MSVSSATSTSSALLPPSALSTTVKHETFFCSVHSASVHVTLPPTAHVHIKYVGRHVCKLLRMTPTHFYTFTEELQLNKPALILITSPVIILLWAEINFNTSDVHRVNYHTGWVAKNSSYFLKHITS